MRNSIDNLNETCFHMFERVKEPNDKRTGSARDIEFLDDSLAFMGRTRMKSKTKVMQITT